MHSATPMRRCCVGKCDLDELANQPRFMPAHHSPLDSNSGHRDGTCTSSHVCRIGSNRDDGGDGGYWGRSLWKEIWIMTTMAATCGGGGKNLEFILEERSTRCSHRSRRPTFTTPLSNDHAIFVKQSGSLVQKLGEFDSK